MTEKAVLIKITHVCSIWGLPLLLIFLFSTMWYSSMKNLMRFEQEFCEMWSGREDLRVIAMGIWETLRKTNHWEKSNCNCRRSQRTERRPELNRTLVIFFAPFVKQNKYLLILWEMRERLTQLNSFLLVIKSEFESWGVLMCGKWEWISSFCSAEW